MASAPHFRWPTGCFASHYSSLAVADRVSTSDIMLRQQAEAVRAARLGAAALVGAYNKPLRSVISGQWRSLAGQAAPVDSPGAGLALPPFDYFPPPYSGPLKEEVLRLRKQHLSPGVFQGSSKAARCTRRRQLPSLGLCCRRRRHWRPCGHAQM